jgi:hypothetical protein
MDYSIPGIVICFDSPRTTEDTTLTADDCQTILPSALASVSYPLVSCTLFHCQSTSKFCVQMTAEISACTQLENMNVQVELKVAAWLTLKPQLFTGY